MSLIQGHDSAPYGIKSLGSTYLTELAVDLQQIQADPLGFLLPQRVIQEREIRVEQRNGNIRVLGVVQPGMPNQLNRFDTAQSWTFSPAYFRRGMFLDQDVINHLRAPGKTSQQMGMDLVQEQLTELTEQANMMLSVLRAQLLTGGINYTDSETGVNITAASGIPAANYYTIGTTAPTSSSAHWHDTANSTPIDDLVNLIFKFEIDNKAVPTHLIMSGHVAKLLMMNKQVRSYLNPETSAALLTGSPRLIELNAMGWPTRICGMDVIVVKTVYDDLDGSNNLVRRYMWPINKVVMLCNKNPLLPSQNLGYTVLSRGEHPNGHNGSTGVWVRTFMGDTLGGPTTAPGVGMQLGMAGLPVLYKPSWVAVLTVATVNEITTANASTKYVV